MEKRLWIGWAFVVYGIIKIAMGTYFATHPGKKKDRSQAGRIMDRGLMLFGAFTLLHGMAVLRWLPKEWNAVLNDQIVSAVVYSLFGIFFIGVSLALVFTDWIEKDEELMFTYEMVGLVGGFVFVIGTLVMLFYQHAVSPMHFVLLVVEFGICLLLVAWYQWQRHRAGKIRPEEIKGLLMVPLGVTA